MQDGYPACGGMQAAYRLQTAPPTAGVLSPSIGGVRLGEGINAFAISQDSSPQAPAPSWVVGSDGLRCLMGVNVGAHDGLPVISYEFQVFPEELPMENLKLVNQLITPYPGSLEPQAWCREDSQ